ncbi:MAG: hypothetical protein KF703_15900 [Actinobacteria bacterium]|nr:hypothetical protein [Actinomycetota bacterium]
MATDPTTQHGTPIAGWVLRADRAVFDVAAMIEEFGQVFRHPVAAGERAEQLAPGQPCFLYVTDTSRVVGIGAVGEVVAPVLVAPVDLDDPDGPQQHYAEVELLPIEKAIPLTKLRDHPVLGGSEIVTGTDLPNPLALDRDEVRAIESFEFAFVEPTEEQAARLEEVLGEEDTGLIFQVVGAARSLGVLDDGADDELLAVVTVTDEGAFELGRFEQLADALDLVRLHAADLELEDPVAAPDHGLPDADPVAVMLVEDGTLGLYRVGPDAFDLYEPDEAGDYSAVARFPSVVDAITGILESVEEVDDDEG